MTSHAACKVSIVTCFLNVESYIEETIQSVLNQEHKNWELLLIDDGSTDKSTDIAKHYANQYPDKIFYFHHEGHRNKGASYSRNIAIGKATGKYVAFLDADDVWLPVYLEHQLEVLEQHAAAMVCEATEYWHDWNSSGKGNIVIPVGTEQDRLYLPPRLMLNLYPLGQGAAPCICGMLVKREAIIKYGGFDNSFAGMYDDQALLIKLYLHEKIFISSAVHNRYRQRPESLVHSSHRSGNYHQERQTFLEWLEVYLQQQQVQDNSVKKLLRKALYPYHHPRLHYMTNILPVRLKRLMRQLR